MRRWVRRIALTGLAAIVLWTAGLAWFISTTDGLASTAAPGHADGIAALTGGAGRVERALRLLANGQADRLLISGVGRAEFPELAQRAGVDPVLGARVTLGHAAVNTRGNALEVADWARRASLRSVIVVTSTYHMPRALLELRRVAPHLELYPVAVVPPLDRDFFRLRVLAGEYVKFLAAAFGLSRLDQFR